jgi:4-diphosphocytidyl-2-C-methyl-D-erythritol kinase
MNPKKTASNPASNKKPLSDSFKRFSLKSPAKINLILKITGIRENGYHNIASLFQMIDLCDVITFGPEPSGKVRVTCSDRTIPQKKNLAFRAAMSIWRPGVQGVHIHIKKNIPSGAGLGGGSSNAATVLLALNRIWRLGLANSELRKKGKTIGADVPFFLFAPRAWVTGIGEKLRALPPAERFHILLVKPKVKVPTQKAYENFDKQLTRPLKSFNVLPLIKGRGFSLDKAVQLLANDLEETVLKSYPVIARVKKELLDLKGSKGVMLTGSGSAVFALFSKRSEATFAYRSVLREFPWWCKVASPVDSIVQIL